MGATAIIGAVVAVAGIGMGVVSSIQQGQAQSRAAQAQSRGYAAQAEASRRNADVARQNAEYIQQAGAIEEQKQREKGLRLLGTQQALYGKAGVTNEGTPLEVMADTAGQLEKDALTTRWNYMIKSQRALSEADQYDFMGDRSTDMAGFADTSAGFASTAGYMKAGTTLLTGLGQVGEIYKGMKVPTESESLVNKSNAYNWKFPNA